MTWEPGDPSAPDDPRSAATPPPSESAGPYQAAPSQAPPPGTTLPGATLPGTADPSGAGAAPGFPTGSYPPGPYPPTVTPPGAYPPGAYPPGAIPPQGGFPTPGMVPPPNDPRGPQAVDPWNPWPGTGPPTAPWAGPSPLPPPPAAPAWQPPPAFPLAPDAYPVNISYDRSARFDRLWGIPLLGVAVRAILVIPHLILLTLIAIIVAIQLLLTWIPILLLGRFPGWGYRWIGGYLGWVGRVGAYVTLLSPVYPPFSLAGESYPVRVRYDEGVRIFRLWGIPILGTLIRAILLLPHFVILWFVGVLAGILLLVTWVPVLFTGRQADTIYTIVGGANRWWLRVAAYLFKMVDRYPPFSLGEDDPAL